MLRVLGAAREKQRWQHACGWPQAVRRRGCWGIGRAVHFMGFELVYGSVASRHLVSLELLGRAQFRGCRSAPALVLGTSERLRGGRGL